MCTACPLHCCAAGAFVTKGTPSCFDPSLGMSAPHLCCVGAPLRWSAFHIICHPDHLFTPATVLYLPIHAGSIHIALPRCLFFCSLPRAYILPMFQPQHRFPCPCHP